MRLFIQSIFIVIYISFSISNGNAQTIEGQVKDAITNNSLPFASIAIEGTSRGTISNENGDFIMDIKEDDKYLIISFIGYESKKVSILSDQQSIIIHLKEADVQLSELVVGRSDADLNDLFRKVQKKLRKAPIQESRAYLKVQSDERKEPIELLECYYNASTCASGVKELHLKNGRAGVYLQKDKKYLSMSLSKFFAYFNLGTEQDYMPYIPFQLNKRLLRKYYNLKHISIVGDSISLVHFRPIYDSTFCFAGDVWINHKDYTIQEIKLQITDANIFPLVPIYNEDKLENINLNATLTFRNYNGIHQLSHIEFNYYFDYIHYMEKGVFYDPLKEKRHITASGLLYFFEYENSFELPFYRYNEELSDYTQINLLSLNSDFWKMNHGLPLTKVEQQKLAFFGQKGLLLNYYSQNDIQTRDKDGTAFTTANIVWRDSIRISLIEDFKNEAAPDRAFLSSIIADKYNIEVQLFLDLNEIGDSIQYYSATILDLTNTYYLLEKEPFTDIFINMYFDLCEIERRKMVIKIEKGPKNIERIKRIYNESQTEMKQVTEQYLDEIQRGRNIRKIAEYSKYINAELGIDNVQMLGVGLD